ncbi:hypothetical protein CRM22_009220 [Opisthorchis felineus]|uniref:PH domain-containing protein n=1 Tax=Opisthorchis felineus TaxID=147828 RepID=A0A4S2L8B6_OPIFE|nr:hypothetical protein CRM22_009220 [Opisthorchis felineus]
MAEVGRLIEAVLSVKHKRKWKRRLCILEKLATFTNSLKISVVDQEKSVCCSEDVVHAFISFLEPNRQGTVMLVCNYRVRCISFDHFEELNRWVRILKTHLTCSYFHADLIMASKESKLSSHAKRRRRHQLSLWSSKRSQHSATVGTNSTGVFRSFINASDDGYLHVTRDRIYFTTGPGCAHPRLLATWSFDNDELVQCGTARIKTNEDTEQLDVDKASLFFLTASPYHPDAPGCHLFLSDRATELCEWIENNNQSAIYQAEWRRLTSLAAVLDTPFSSGPVPSGLVSTSDQPLSDHSHTTPFNVVHTTQLGTSCASTQCCQCSLASEYYSLERIQREEADDTPPSQTCGGTAVEHAHHHHQHPSNGLPQQMEHARSLGSSSLSDQSFRPDVQANAEPIIASTSGALTKRWMRVGTPSDMTDIESKLTCGMSFAQAEFERRKWIAMHSRRRFSSHPVDTYVRGSGPTTSDPQALPFLASAKGVSLCCTHKAGALPCQVSWVDGHNSLAGSQWRQSEPQLVTISPMPMSLQELRQFLRKPRVTSTSPQPSSDQNSHSSKPTTTDLAQKPPDLSTDHSVREPKHCYTSRQNRLSECSTGSAADSITSDVQCPYCTCSQCNLPLGAGEDCASPLTSVDHLWSPPFDSLPPGSTTNRPTVRRRRLPSSWSNTAGAAQSLPEPGSVQCHSILIQPRSLSGCAHPPPLLNLSLSSGNSPQYALTPLLPNSTIIPGSQYFPPRRYHTASASESSPPFRTGGPDCSTGHCSSASAVLNPSAKASLVSLSPSAAPLWADAPVHAKPRTGGNYVSRDMLIAWHTKKKRLQQKLQSPSPTSGEGPSDRPPPPSGNCPITTCSTPMPPMASVGPSFVQLHPCTPVPEALRESDDMTSPRNAHQPGSLIDHQKVLVSTTSLTHTYCTDPRAHSCSSDLTCSSGKLCSADQHVGTCPDPALTRSYINVVPPSRRACLQPIDERQAMRSALTQPIARRQCLDINGSTVPPEGSCSVGTLCSYVNVNELCKTNVTNLSSCSATAPSPVDIGSPASSNSAISSAAQCYINLAPSQLTCSSSSRGRGLRGIPLGPDEPNFISLECPPLESAAILTTHTPGCSSVASALSLTSTPSTIVSCDTSGSEGTVRLHYAHLTLSTNLTNRCSNGSGPSSVFTNSPASDHLPGHLHGIQSVPNAFSPNIFPVSTTSDTDPKPTSGVNYVTIDLVQTKALSEVEQELRSSTAVETLAQHRSMLTKARGFRSNLRRGFAGANSTTSAAPEVLRTGSRLERISSYSGPVSSSFARRVTASDLTNAPLHSRLFNCLAQSLIGSSGASIRKQQPCGRRPSNTAPTAMSSSTPTTLAPIPGPNVIQK